MAEERRAKIAEDYKNATALKDATTAELNQFKLGFVANVEDFDETVITDPDTYAHYEWLMENYRNADTAYNLAAVQIQDQLAEAAAAAKALADK